MDKLVERRRVRLALCLTGVLLCIWLPRCKAEEVRVIDAAGMVRAVKIVKKTVSIVVTVDAEVNKISIPKGECTAINVDGLASERRVPISANGACVFTDVAEGTWQVRVPGEVSWRVRINE